MSKASDAKLESEFQAKFVKRLRKTYEPGIIILKNDTGYQQGIPDLTIYLAGFVALIEVKPYEGAPYEPNQEYFLALADSMGHFSATLYPENEEVVFNALRTASRAA